VSMAHRIRGLTALSTIRNRPEYRLILHLHAKQACNSKSELARLIHVTASCAFHYINEYERKGIVTCTHTGRDTYILLTPFGEKLARSLATFEELCTTIKA
jgi:Mn-dependent DtxR family transcriptional regulator